MRANRCNGSAGGRFAASACAVLVLLASSAGQAHDQRGKAVETGLASYYADTLHGRITANGETFDRNAMVAAHPRYPFGTRVHVKNPENGRSVVVRINDRGPTRKNRREGVIIDLSPAAAAKLDILEDGRARVIVEVREWGEDAGK